MRNAALRFEPQRIADSSLLLPSRRLPERGADLAGGYNLPTPLMSRLLLVLLVIKYCHQVSGI